MDRKGRWGQSKIKKSYEASWMSIRGGGIIKVKRKKGGRWRRKSYEKETEEERGRRKR